MVHNSINKIKAPKLKLIKKIEDNSCEICNKVSLQVNLQ